MEMKKVLKYAMEIGEWMLKSGAGVSRVEDTISRICKAYGAKEANVFSITSSIVTTIEDEEGEIITQTKRIRYYKTDFKKLDELNQLSRYMCKYLPEEEYAKLEGLDVLILTALRRGAHPTHESLEEALANIERIKPKETYLIHMSHRIGLHAEVEKELPPHVHLAYDGLHVSTALSHSLLFRK